MYYLYDPRNCIVCYVGITTNFNKRLKQHQKPKDSLNTRIAKLQRSLLQKGLSLSGAVIAESYSKYYISFLEKRNISRLRYTRGCKQIQNISNGGYDGYTHSDEVISKMLETRRINNKPIPRGEQIYNTNLTESDIKHIYDLINQGYSNTDILSIVENTSRTQISMIRNGSNWNHLFVKYNMVSIPSMPTLGCITGKERVDMLRDIDSNIDINLLVEKYPKISKSDINRIVAKRIWKKCWKVYNDYFKNKIN